MKVLLVDDDLLVLKVCTAILRGTCELSTAKTIDEALEQLWEGPFDVLVTDLDLRDPHGRDGIWLLTEAKQHHHVTRRVLMSGRSWPEIAPRFDDNAVHQFLPKPVSARTLWRITNQEIQRSRGRVRSNAE